MGADDIAGDVLSFFPYGTSSKKECVRFIKELITKGLQIPNDDNFYVQAGDTWCSVI